MKQEDINRIKSVRLKKNISEIDISEELNIDLDRYSSFEEGNDSLTGDELLRLAKYLDFSLDELNEDSTKNDNIKPNKSSYTRHIILLVIATIIYLLIGFLSKNPYRWGCWWVVYLFALSLDSFIDAIIKKDISEFSLILDLIGLYVIIGFYFNLWHPGWIIFFVEVVYSILIYKIDEHKKK